MHFKSCTNQKHWNAHRSTFHYKISEFEFHWTNFKRVIKKQNSKFHLQKQPKSQISLDIQQGTRFNLLNERRHSTTTRRDLKSPSQSSFSIYDHHHQRSRLRARSPGIRIGDIWYLRVGLSEFRSGSSRSSVFLSPDHYRAENGATYIYDLIRQYHREIYAPARRTTRWEGNDQLRFPPKKVELV